MEAGTSAQANFNFDTTDVDELPLQSGDIVQIIEIVDENWAIGTANGRTGRFPTSFVSPVEEPGSAGTNYHSGEFVVAIETFLADTDGDLGFNKGDTIEIVTQVDENWLRGRINGKEGIFPCTYIIQHGGTSQSGLTCRVITSSVGQLSDELTVSEGDVITNLEKVDDDWFRGSCNGRTGLVPALCVEIIEDNTHGGNTASVNFNLEDFSSVVKQGEDISHVKSEAIGTEPSVTESSGSSQPSAISLFPFSAESKKELSFMDNEQIRLLYRIDNDWLVGNIDGNVGMFPASFVNVVVDVPDGYDERPQSYKDLCKTGVNSKEIESNNSNNIEKPGILELPNANQGKKGRVLFDFEGQTEQDLSVKKGDVITIVEQLDTEWYEAQNDMGSIGFIPVSYVKVLEKLKSPSLKRQAPPPPIKKRTPVGKKPPLPAKSAKAAELVPNIPNGASELLDIFGPIPDTSGNSKDNSPVILSPVNRPKPALAPKPSPTHKPVNTVTNLLDLDPFPVTDTTSIPSSGPSGNSSKPVFLPSNLPRTEKQGASSVSPSISSTVGSTLIDFSPSDKPQTSVLTPVIHNSSAITTDQPQSPTKVIVKQGSVDSLSGILTAKPFGAASTTVRSVHRPVAKTSPEKQPAQSNFSSGAVDISLANVFNQKVNSAFDSVDPLLESFGTPVTTSDSFNPFNANDNQQIIPSKNTAQPSTSKTSDTSSTARNITPFSAAVEEIFAKGTKEKVPPIRQPSPNPFAPATVEESKDLNKASANPFSAEDNLGFCDDFEVDTQLGKMPRDESVNSELSSDDFNSLMPSFVIKPVDTIEPPSDTKSAFILPPPPSPAKRTGLHIDKPKPKKFNQNSAVPRPRPRPQSMTNNGQGGTYIPEPSFPLIASQQALLTNDLVGFEVSSNSATDITDDDAGQPPPAYPPPELPSDVDDGILTDESSLVVGDLLGLVGSDTVQDEDVKPRRSAPSRPLKEPTKKNVPPRPAPPRPVNMPRYQPYKQGEEEVLVQRQEDVTAVDASQTKDMVAALKASMAEFQSELERQTKEKQQLEQEMSFLECDASDNVMVEKYNEVVHNITQLTDKVASLKEQIEELEPDEKQAAKKKKAEMREKVVNELLNTEEAYQRDIILCRQGFMTILEDKEDEINVILAMEVEDSSEKSEDKKKTKGLELDILFGNIDQVIEVSGKFLESLKETIVDVPPQDQLIGACFMEHCKDLEEVYKQYCRNHDDATALLEKYEENNEILEYINQGLEVVRKSTNCWDLASFLIKPVQRILKYQLLIGELDKHTDDNHKDKENIKKAWKTMLDVAGSINEFKRRKDIVVKYRKQQAAITDKLGRINLHSFKKKTTRMNQRWIQLTGLSAQTIDEEFEQHEKRFNTLEKTIKIFVKDINAYLEHLKDATAAEAIVGADISEYYANQSNLKQVNKYEAVQKRIANKLYKNYTLFVQQRVISPLNLLLIMFQGPHKLIQKRYDKLLDYDSCINKVEKTKDKEKLKGRQKDKIERLKEEFEEDVDGNCVRKKSREVTDEKEVARKNYEALNIQLKDELPKLCEMSSSLFKECVAAYIEAESDHIHSTLKQLHPLLELPIVKSSCTDNVMDTFEQSHVSEVEKTKQFSFVSSSFDKKDQKEKKSVKRVPSTDQMLSQASSEVKPKQTQANKEQVMTRYSNEQLHLVTASFKAAEDLDMTVMQGEIIGVIKQQDPRGGQERWYIDNGASTGFIPPTILTPYKLPSYEQALSIQYYAAWEFTATGPHEVSLEEGCLVSVISSKDMEGNSEWWLVESDGQQGYVPAAYIKPLQ
ncbi:dynamin-binding protein-like isoform X1 [Anneissia japonica]|uniref:dynamin-binding protein-like isoform X1 n=1 Tax=Anneissia japonica TaxID=1529436 RepID=UPI0014259238|nr:dynamin-binding protein-like isoform X1 [Anneissia japonica]